MTVGQVLFHLYYLVLYTLYYIVVNKIIDKVIKKSHTTKLKFSVLIVIGT